MLDYQGVALLGTMYGLVGIGVELSEEVCPWGVKVSNVQASPTPSLSASLDVDA